MNSPRQPRFSIVTVTYNAGNVLESTLLSVIRQTYPYIEYIIIDGGSTDGTLNIIDTYKASLACVISEPDKGLYDAMNKGIREATGDYICFLNAGDTFHTNHTLQQIVDSIRGSSGQFPDILYGETAIVDSKRNFLYMRGLSAPETLTWKSFKQGMLVCHQAFFVNTGLVESYDLQYRFSSDFDWCIRMLKKAKHIHNTHLILIDYLKEGMTTQNHKASLKERFRIMVKYYGWTSTILHHAWFIVRLLFKPEK